MLKRGHSNSNVHYSTFNIERNNDFAPLARLDTVPHGIPLLPHVWQSPAGLTLARFRLCYLNALQHSQTHTAGLAGLRFRLGKLGLCSM